MAFSQHTILEVRYAGSDANNGGGFDCGCTFDNTLTCTTNTGNTTRPEVYCSASVYSFVAGDVGKWLFIKTGTNWTQGWYEIESVSAGKATIKADVGEAYLVSVISSAYTPKKRNTVAGCATVGTPTSGSWGIDYSQQDSPQITFSSDITIASTTTFTNAGVGKNLIGNIVNLTDANGSGATLQRYVITATSSTTATVDKTMGVGSGSGLSGYLGGALSTPGLASYLVQTAAFGGTNGCCDVFIKYNATAFTMTSSTVNVTGGKVSVAGNGVYGNPCYWVGYDTNRMTQSVDANRPTLKNGAYSSLTVFTLTSEQIHLRNLIVDGNSQSSVTGIYLGSYYDHCERCKVINCTAYGVQMASVYSRTEKCEVTACSGTAAFSNTSQQPIVDCYAHHNSCTGFSGQFFLRCISAYNTGSSSVYGFVYTFVGMWTECTAVGNQGHGFYASSNGGLGMRMDNCLAWGNGGTGIYYDYALALTLTRNCASGGNTGPAYSSTITTDVNCKTLTADPFVDSDTGDCNFALNNTAGGGAECRAAGFPGAYQGGLTTGYLDIGAAQHQDAGGGGGGSTTFFVPVE